MKRKSVVTYWIESSDIDFSAMETLFSKGHNSWALFLGHIVIEKLLKAYYAQMIDSDVPRTHDLLQIAENTGLELTEEQKNILDELTTFNIKARYPDYKMRFHAKADHTFTQQYIGRIEEMRKWLLERIKI